MLNEIQVANKMYAVVPLDKNDTADEIALNVMRVDLPAFLMPMKVMNMNNTTEFRYEMSGGTRMEYTPLTFKKAEAVQLLVNMVSPFADCVDWFMDYHHFLLDKNYIMLNTDDYSVKYIYNPSYRGRNEEKDILDFFMDLFLEMEITDDAAYANILAKSVRRKGATIFTLLEELKATQASMAKEGFKAVQPVAEKVPEPVVPVYEKVKEVAPVVEEKVKKVIDKKKPAVESDPFSSGASLPGAEIGFGENDELGELGSALFGDDDGKSRKDKKVKKEKEKKVKKEKTVKEPKQKKEKEEKAGGLFGGILGKKKKQEENIFDEFPVKEVKKPEPKLPFGRKEQKREPVQAPLTDYDVQTELPDDDIVQAETGFRMRLESKDMPKAPETITLDLSSGPKTVGRYDKSGQKVSDVSLDISLTFIGRTHMRFEQDEQGQVYVIDLNTKNHTYLNGEELMPNYRYPVDKGDTIMISRKYRLTYRVC